jgi:ketosteroid isomerase-like protein
MPAAVRTRIGPGARLPNRRTLDERLFIRWPGAFRTMTRAGTRLPPRSRLRRALLKRNALSAWGAWVRADFESMLVRFAPDYVYEPPREWLAVGMRSEYRGHAGLREWTADMREAWDWLDNMPFEVIDGGNPVVFVNDLRLRARGSGVEFDYRAGFVIWIERGLIVRESDFLDSDEALRVAGISTARLRQEGP